MTKFVACIEMLNNIFPYITKRLNRSDERSANAVKNILASFAIKGVSIAISFLLIPMTIGYVDKTQYGIWITLSTIIFWFSSFDIGFGNGLRNRFAEAKATGNFSSAKSYISTTYICLTIIFTVIWILFFVVNFFIDWSLILNAPAQMAKDLSLVAIVSFSFFCVQIVLKTTNTILIADQKPAKSAFLDMLGQIITLGLIFTLTKTTSGSLLYLAIALGIAPIVVIIPSSIWLFTHDYKKYKPSLRLFEKRIVKDILSLGGKFFLIQSAAIAIYETTNLIIAQVSSPDNVAVYNTAYRYFNIAQMGFVIIISPFWSAFTDAYTKKEISWMKNTYKRLFQFILLIVLGVFVLLAISPFFYNIWIGDKLFIPMNVSIFVAIYIISLIFANLHSNILNGVGKIKLQLIFSNSSIFINIPFAWFLGLEYGIIGVIIPSIVLNCIAATLYAIQVRKVLSGKATGIWNK